MINGESCLKASYDMIWDTEMTAYINNSLKLLLFSKAKIEKTPNLFTQKSLLDLLLTLSGFVYFYGFFFFLILIQLCSTFARWKEQSVFGINYLPQLFLELKWLITECSYEDITYFAHIAVTGFIWSWQDFFKTNRDLSVSAKHQHLYFECIHTAWLAVLTIVVSTMSV